MGTMFFNACPTPQEPEELIPEAEWEVVPDVALLPLLGASSDSEQLPGG